MPRIALVLMAVTLLTACNKKDPAEQVYGSTDTIRTGSPAAGTASNAATPTDASTMATDTTATGTATTGTSATGTTDTTATGTQVSATDTTGT